MKLTILSFVILLIAALAAYSQTTEFSYQGSLRDGATVANGNYDFEFRLYDALTAGAQHPTVVSRPNVVVTNGVFSVKLDFFSALIGAFPGADRYLEIRAKIGGDPAFTTLSPRQKIGGEPYAQKSLNSDTATTATNSAQLGGVAASQYVQTNDARLTNDRNPLPGSNNYIRNSGAGQPGASFNIGGSANIDGGLSVAVTGGSFGVGGNSFLSGNLTVNGSSTVQNLTVNGTLTANLPSGDTSYVQNRTTQQPTTNFNISGNGTVGGTLNAASVDASVAYRMDGQKILTNVGTRNIFAGVQAGDAGTDNAFFGYNAGNANLSTGINNAFFGSDAGGNTTSGSGNTFIGRNAGDTNTLGTNNTVIGNGADVAVNTFGFDPTFATAIGAGAVVSSSNNLVLGRPIDVVRIPGALSVVDDVTVGNLLAVQGDVGIVGSVQILTLGSAGATSLCQNTQGIISTCSSSLRYKTNINRFSPGLNIINQLKPITFDWKDGAMKDVGFGAEDVAKIDPRFVTYNASGQVEGVKYDRLNVAFVNAFKEQQAQIEAQEKKIVKQSELINELRSDFEVLKAILCSQNRVDLACKKQN